MSKRDAFDAAAEDAAQRELELSREEIARLKIALARKVRNEAQIAIQVRDALRDLPRIQVPSPRIKVGRGSEEAAILACGHLSSEHVAGYLECLACDCAELDTDGGDEELGG